MSQTPVLYLLGGPMRVGKSIIARRFNATTAVSWVGVDDIIEMLEFAAPEPGLRTDTLDGWRLARERAHPYVEGFARIRLQYDTPTIIEGEIDPATVARLLQDFPSKVRACFVGNIDIALGEKVQLLLAHRDSDPHDWLRDQPLDYVRTVAALTLEDSLVYRDAAARLDVPFFDLGRDFESGAAKVLDCLSSG